MSISPSDFLGSAKEMAQEKNETAKRNALSRSYYAAYHLLKNTFPLPKDLEFKGMHRTFIDYLVNHPSSSVERRLGLQLSKLYSRRIRADYHLGDSITPGDVALQISTTDAIFEGLNPGTETATA